MLAIRSYAAPISEPRLRGGAGTFTRNSVRPHQLAIQQNENDLFVATEGGAVYECKLPFRKYPRVYTKEQLTPVVQGVALSNGQHF